MWGLKAGLLDKLDMFVQLHLNKSILQKIWFCFYKCNSFIFGVTIFCESYMTKNI